MKRFNSITKPLMWFTAILLAVFVAGCGSDNTSDNNGTPTSATKAITAYSLAGTTGTINETAKTITVDKPSGTNVTFLVATFTTTGASVKVGTTVQVSGTMTNDFTNPVAYIVTAADGTTATYTVTVTVAVAAGPAAIDLLSILTNNFVVLSNSATTGITDTGSHSAAITGNIGLSPGTAAAIGVWCSEMTGKIYGADVGYVGDGLDVTCFKGLSADNTTVANAVLDLGTAYTAASDPATPAATDAAHLNVGAGTLTAGTTFTPGVYTWGTDVNVTGDITLTGSASDVWIFQMSGNLNLAAAGSLPAGTHIILSGGAVASNVFWQVGGGTGATLGTFSTFYGNILSATQVVMQTGAVLHGRALATTAVILDANPVGP
jgi:hypothetical protein